MTRCTWPRAIPGRAAKTACSFRMATRFTASASSAAEAATRRTSTWSFEDGATTRRLVAHKQGDRVTDIALASPDQKTFFAQLDATAEILMPIDPSTLTSFKVSNLPAEITLEYVADVQDGSRIVVTRPRDDWSYDDFRVFYGRGDQLIERVVTQVGRGSFTIIEFVVDGANFKATFTSILAPSITSNLDTGTGDVLHHQRRSGRRWSRARCSSACTESAKSRGRPQIFSDWRPRIGAFGAHLQGAADRVRRGSLVAVLVLVRIEYKPLREADG